jgi:superfamily II DNA/RNA helicase
VGPRTNALRCARRAGGHPWGSQRKQLEAGVDLVVATPGRLAEHLSAGTLTLERCGTVVLDETDVLLGDAGAFREQARRARRRRPLTEARDGAED